MRGKSVKGSNSPAFALSRNWLHSPGVNSRTGPSGSLESRTRTLIVRACRNATSTQALPAQLLRDFRHLVMAVALSSPLCCRPLAPLVIPTLVILGSEIASAPHRGPAAVLTGFEPASSPWRVASTGCSIGPDAGPALGRQAGPASCSVVHHAWGTVVHHGLVPMNGWRTVK
jgi:hypothetical protein